MTMITQKHSQSAQSDDELRKKAFKNIIQPCELSVNRNVAHMSVQCESCIKCKTCKEIKTINASSYNDFREQLVMDQLVSFTPGNIHTVKGNKATADTQNRDMVRRLQKEPLALEHVKQEMKCFRTLALYEN